jgi:predicted Ser/Thr protein kinase
MTEIHLLILVLFFLGGCFGVVYYFDKKLVKAIIEYEKRLDKKGILKRHFSKPEK